MAFVQVRPIERAPYTENKSAGFVVTACLTAREYAARSACAFVLLRLWIEPILVCPAATNVAADVAAGPTGCRCRRRFVKGRLYGHVSGHRRRCKRNRNRRAKERSFHAVPRRFITNTAEQI